MSTATATAPLPADAARAIADAFVQFLETNDAPEGLFTDSTFLDLTLPRWRLQCMGGDDLVALRRESHPAIGTAHPVRLDPTPTGFVLEIEERWNDDDGEWYCRELFRVDVAGDAVTAVSIYCTGDWDEARVAEHAAAITLLRP